ncbi:hypothetical protein BDN70DRAFT_874121 [Pholiota conissans]|uniref:Uncharacterized protein n=1 Tax=Pholiota conissans TaxID=109636 RepID=A0A9P6D543_9AGAR|nr:hypothetical protein BDN70DRAFT_874121 [Pholiota conissans]
MPLRRAISIWPEPIPITLKVLPYVVLAFVLEGLLYGIHLVIFCLCVRVLLPRRRKLQRMMLGAIIVMFILATIDVAMSWRLFLGHTHFLYGGTSATFLRAVQPKIIIHLVNNVLADSLLLIRCFVVWSRRKIILYIGGALLCAITVVGIISEGTTSFRLKQFIAVYNIANLVWNLAITILTAGKIIWIAREASQVVGPKILPHYHFAIAVLVESGMLYTISSILVLALLRTPYVLIAAAIAIRLTSIVPILIIVQVALGRSIQDVQRTISRLQGETTTQEIVLDTIISTAHDHDTEAVLRDNASEEIATPEPAKEHSIYQDTTKI